MTVAVYVVLYVRFADGPNVAVFVPVSYDTAPVTVPVTALTVKFVVLIVVAFIASQKVAVMTALNGTPVAPLIGIVDVTVGVLAAHNPALPAR
jgi:hypothetical protein